MTVYSTRKLAYTFHSRRRAYERQISWRAIRAVIQAPLAHWPSAFNPQARLFLGADGVCCVVNVVQHRVLTVYRMRPGAENEGG